MGETFERVLQTPALVPSLARPHGVRSAAPSGPPVSDYEYYCHPRTAQILRRLRLDRTYQRALGDLLFYRDEGGEERAVVDFLGGYGAALLGHNHPELCRLFARMLERGVPFHAQASSRTGAGALGRRLDERLYAATGRHFVTRLAK